MNFECKKTEDCFAASRTYEYKLPSAGAEIAARLSGWQIRENTRLRRPVFSADRDGVNVKGVLADGYIRVSYPEDRWEAEKSAFESWLEGLDV